MIFAKLTIQQGLYSGPFIWYYNREIFNEVECEDDKIKRKSIITVSEA